MPPPRRRRRRRRRGPRRPSGPASLRDAQRLARDRFGIPRLHPEQAQALTALLAGQDALVVLPTGYGKSLIYQVAALLQPRPTLVVSPLIALMQDQERSLRRKGAPVVRLDSTLSKQVREDTLRRIRKGKTLIVLTTPETLRRADTAEVLQQARPALLCVDEAHCVSEWGHDFRPDYLRLGEVREQLEIPQVLALTATAPPRVREDVALRLGLRDPAVITAPPHRKNLRLAVEVVHGDVKYEVAARLLRKLRRPGIVYCATTRAVEQLASALQRARIPADAYHGKLPQAERRAAQKRFFRRGKPRVMVATNAFGMGIDKPDIRFVLHFHTPGSLESYVQEAGRAGRDGKRAHCVLLFDPADLEIQRRLQAGSRPSSAQLRRVAQALAQWEEPVGVRALALAASTPQTVTGVICSQLQAAGLLERDARRRYQPAADADALVEGAAALASSYATQAEEDERRLEAMAAYATGEECRSVMIRRWFGEEDPPRCGLCDRCQER